MYSRKMSFITKVKGQKSSDLAYTKRFLYNIQEKKSKMDT